MNNYAVIFVTEQVAQNIEETIERYEKFGIPYYRTDLHGTIVVTSNGESLSITTEKTPQ